MITGEGSLDRQTLEGKTPAGVARLARKLGKPVFAIVGRTRKIQKFARCSMPFTRTRGRE